MAITEIGSIPIASNVWYVILKNVRIKMKIFERWDKVNFVDENNVFLGYDLAQSCCEHAGWFIADEPTNIIVEREEDKPSKKNPEIITELNGWVFDKEYFKQINKIPEEGSIAVFRIFNSDLGLEFFVHLFNCHNGYYSHGFEFKENENILKSDYI